MDAASAHSVDTPSAGWDAFPVPKQPPRHAEPTWARLPLPTAAGQFAVPIHERRANPSSATWTSSSGDFADLSDADDLEIRDEFVQEYNRVAKKPGQSPLQQRPGWFSRTFLRQPSTASDGSSTKSEKKIKTKRSISDLALRVVNGTKKDGLQDEDLQSLVRLCGKSKLYLPSEYSPCSLVLPTCFRATAQYLIQHVNALYAHYCADGDPDDISNTISCPNLPTHIKTGPHDVASTFKRLLSGLPGGILGSLSLFDALVAIHSELKGGPEFLKTKQTKLRARLIALAIGTVKSRLRRDLICAVFGLLCLIGRAAEKAPREDEHGRPLPTSDLMGYNALGIVFGPLLVGDILNSYTIQAVDTTPGPALFSATPPNVSPLAREALKKLTPCLAGVEASLLSPPMEEPSPAEHSRLKGLDGADSRQSHHPQANHSAPITENLRETPKTPNRKSEGFQGWQNVENRLRATSRGANPFKRNPLKDGAASDADRGSQKEEIRTKKTLEEKVSQNTLRSTLRTSLDNEDVHGDKSRVDVFGLGRSRLAAWRSKRKSLVSTGPGSPVPTHSHPRKASGERTGSESSRDLLLNQRKTESKSSPTTRHQGDSIQGHGGFSKDHVDNTPLRALSGNTVTQIHSLEEENLRHGTGILQEDSSRDGDKKTFHSGTRRSFPLGPRPDPGRPLIATVPQPRPTKLDGKAVKAMAAMFESAAKDLNSLPPSTENIIHQVDSRSSGMISPYTVNPPSPTKSPRPIDPVIINRHAWASTGRDRRSRVLGRGEVSRSNIPIPSRNRGPRPPGRARTPKQLSSVSPGLTTGPSAEVSESLVSMTPETVQRVHRQQPSVVISAPLPEPQLNQTTPTPSPRLKPINDRLTDHHPPSAEEGDPSPASTTRRFPLLPTPEQRHRTASKSSTSTPAQEISTPTSASSPNPSRRLLFHPTSPSTTTITTTHATAIEPNPIPPTDHRLAHAHAHEHESDSDHNPPRPGLWAGTAAAVDLAADLAVVKARLCHVEQECVMWRGRAERAERRVEVLEGRGGGGEEGEGEGEEGMMVLGDGGGIVGVENGDGDGAEFKLRSGSRSGALLGGRRGDGSVEPV
ncbi:hypothetical protein CHGG_07829 [Chaetomium globosum CBS 148.51]|uniref:Rho-GAP domain-containing protein n=1 Tax=Chaetomium globosum (strain ATCC 6205 / CBS 148.51 / DSM 1962 / NBRC 6347 / NRRL 1970) TaxID=306901 RepID=Q2GW25_CHAGB|nr:uncharacterized protein CHGG_07829 [Chaetomium globosum CBS 148.51]EAQ86576.1 hypothetical protein CHGG_07829 [Chaetomium globosum CBS 148.51]